MNISVIGLGKLGSPLAACLAEKGFNVIGVDLNAAYVERINEGHAPVQEPGLEDMIQRNHARLSATTDYETAIADTEATFIIVPTPSNSDGVFSLRYIVDACKGIGRALSRKASYHLVVITSTVMPGSTGGEIRETLEKYAGKRCGDDFGLCYSPEFIALGSVIHDLLAPDFVLIGESDERAGDVLVSIYRQLCGDHPAVARMNFINAELAKISVNTFVTTKISYANMLAEICERLPGADVEVVTAAIGLDKRIGARYLRGATGYGGPCFPRDNVAFGRLAHLIGANADIAHATDQINRRQAERLVERLTARLNAGATVAVLGLAYKPDTNVIEESQGIMLVRNLLAKGYAVLAYDPLAMENARAVLGDNVIYISSAQECVQRADAVVIAIPCQEFETLSPNDVKRDRPYKLIVLDTWRVLDREAFEPVCEYIAIGLGTVGEEPVRVVKEAVARA